MTIEESKQQKRWVCWKLTKVPDRDKPTKVPYTPRGFKASSDDPKTWSTYAECIAVASQFSGVGCALGEGIFGVDIDGCCDAVTGKFTPESREIVIGLDTYTEYSYSGDGCHLLGVGDLDEKYRKNKRKVIVKQIPGCKQIEIKSDGFYFVHTGRHISKTPDELMPRQAQLDALCAKVAETPKPGMTVSVQDESARFAKLWAGDMSDYADNHSVADMALVGMLARRFNNNAFLIDEEFCKSGLYREKWDRLDYKWSTIWKAIKGAEVAAAFDDQEPLEEDTPTEWVVQPLPGRDEGWFPLGEVSLEGGASGAGKTHVVARICENARHGLEVFGHSTAQTDYCILLHDRSSASMRRTCKAANVPVSEVMERVIRLTRAQQKERPAIAVEAAIQTRPGVKLWILEGLDFWTPKIADLEAVGDVMDELQRVAKQYRVAIVGTLGSPKQKENDRYASGRDQFMGSVAFGRKSETCISIESTSDATVRKMNVMPRNTAKEEFYFTWTDAGLTLTTEPTEPDMKADGNSALIRMGANVFAATRFGEELKYQRSFGPPATFFRWRKIAQLEGKVTVSGKKWYRAAGAGGVECGEVA